MFQDDMFQPIWQSHTGGDAKQRGKYVAYISPHSLVQSAIEVLSDAKSFQPHV